MTPESISSKKAAANSSIAYGSFPIFAHSEREPYAKSECTRLHRLRNFSSKMT